MRYRAVLLEIMALALGWSTHKKKEGTLSLLVREGKNKIS
jgi:hypothetical protein